MPHKHAVKIYVENGFYHIYNRGVEKRDIFIDDEDYRAFLHLLKYFLSSEDKHDKHPLAELPHTTLTRPRPLESLSEEVDLLAFCLMPNHFHLLLKQITKDGMSTFMRKLSTTYAMYFNRRYERVGHLFQAVYKAVLITEDAHLLHVSRYIHLNPTELTRIIPVKPGEYKYSSYPYYLGEKQSSWLKPGFILSYFYTKQQEIPSLHSYSTYQKFVEQGEKGSLNSFSHLNLD